MPPPLPQPDLVAFLPSAVLVPGDSSASLTIVK